MKFTTNPGEPFIVTGEQEMEAAAIFISGRHEKQIQRMGDPLVMQVSRERWAMKTLVTRVDLKATSAKEAMEWAVRHTGIQPLAVIDLEVVKDWEFGR